ncbi:MAG: DUF3990 domain-containing protein [Victivallales bacterium]
MILYHGSMVAVEMPQIIRRPNGRGADFGFGFYTTSSRDQAERWVHIRQKAAQTETPGHLSIYDVPDDLLTLPELSIKTFWKADHEWLIFLLANRNDPDFEHTFDVVFGPVANDRVYTTLTLLEGGFLDKNETIERLKTYVLADQYLFHTEKSLQYLKFLNAEEIR